MSATIGFTGDIMSHLGFVIQEAEGHPFRAFFSEPVRQLCLAQDEMWGNLEGPVSNSENGLEIYLRARDTCYTCCPKLFFPKHYIPALVDLNFKILGIANNHSFDFETPQDTKTTSKILKEYGIGAPGLCFGPVVREVGGLSFAIIATTSFLNPPGGCRVALITDETRPALFASVRRWSRRVDYVVVMTHWGNDYLACPPKYVRCLANELLEAGARVIYGNHPHILWPIEQPAPDKLVCYSLGNFCHIPGCDDLPCAKSLHGVLLSVEFKRNKIDAAFYPLLTNHNYNEWRRELGLGRSYWLWTARELEQWQSTISGRQRRLLSRVERNGPPGPVPLTMQEIERSYPWNRQMGQANGGGNMPGRTRRV